MTKSLLSDLRRTASDKSDPPRTPIEQLVEFLLSGARAPNAPDMIEQLAEQALGCDLGQTRVVVLGGGTGLSTIVGGNAQMPDWPEQPWLGIKAAFGRLDSIVCTTDDGGSTGRLLKSLPIIGIGDLRKLLVSSILRENLERTYQLGEAAIRDLVRAIHALFNHRFAENARGFRLVRDPIGAIPARLRAACPPEFCRALRRLGAYIAPGGGGPLIAPAGHAMGNLLLASAIFGAARIGPGRPPGLRQIQQGIDTVAAIIGAPVGRIHAATCTPGQLLFQYANGVQVYGQSKSALARRDSPVERVTAEFASGPRVAAEVLEAIRKADLIIYAPGSLYTSIIPVLQLDPIAEAIRGNRRALKLLGANSWIQEGETDISLKNRGRGFLVSDLIEAYDQNVPRGARGLFDVVLSSNLDQIPGDILRNYALEGKSPIHLDRPRVEAMGYKPVEATLLSTEHQQKSRVIHHDAQRFTLAVRTLLFADSRLRGRKGYALRHAAGGTGRRKPAPQSVRRQSPLLCDCWKSIARAVEGKEFRPAGLKDFLKNLAWENRDIRPAHLSFFRGVSVIAARRWNRSTEWDNVLGYYDPTDGFLKLHEELLSDTARLREDLLVALGESLLGRYMGERRWAQEHGTRRYEIRLRPAGAQESFLSDSQIRAYLRLARMTPDLDDPGIFRLVINDDEGFLPPGLLFGLVYAWYLSGSGLTMDYEMTLLRWPPRSLMPLHAKDRIRKQALVRFFRTEVFGHT